MSWKTINNRNKSRLVGAAGVHRVASELLLRGMLPKFPAVDCGWDLEADGGVRLQVKCAHLSKTLSNGKKAFPEGSYTFHFSRRPTVRHNEVHRRTPPLFSEICEFVILWGIEQNRFWIVPSHILDNVSTILVGPPCQWIDLDIETIRSLKEDLSVSTEELAAKFGASCETIRRRLRGEYIEARRVTPRVRACEGRWDLIEGAVDSLAEAEEVVCGVHQTVTAAATKQEGI